MSIYMNRAFRTSNSSISLQTGTALKSQVLRLRDKSFLLDSGIGTPRTCTQDEVTKPPNQSTRFENRVGFMGSVSNDTTFIKKRDLEQFFIELVAGDSVTKARAAALFNDQVGSGDVVPGEPLLILPRKFRQNRAWTELHKKWRMNSKVNGFVLTKGRAGYNVGIAGFIGFLPFRRASSRILSDRYIIETIQEERKTLVVFNQGSLGFTKDKRRPGMEDLDFGMEDINLLNRRRGAVDEERVLAGNSLLASLLKK